ncbi:MAG: hypothetical protein U0837_08635 [Dehalococcoidia bacterium]
MQAIWYSRPSLISTPAPLLVMETTSPTWLLKSALGLAQEDRARLAGRSVGGLESPSNCSNSPTWWSAQ